MHREPDLTQAQDPAIAPAKHRDVCILEEKVPKTISHVRNAIFSLLNTGVHYVVMSRPFLDFRRRVWLARLSFRSGFILSLISLYNIFCVPGLNFAVNLCNT